MKWLLAVFFSIFGLIGFNLQGGDILPGTLDPSFQCPKVQLEVSEAYTKLNSFKQLFANLVSESAGLQDEIDYYNERISDPLLSEEVRQAFQTIVDELQAELDRNVTILLYLGQEIDKLNSFLDTAEAWMDKYCKETPVNGPMPDPNFP